MVGSERNLARALGLTLKGSPSPHSRVGTLLKHAHFVADRVSRRPLIVGSELVLILGFQAGERASRRPLIVGSEPRQILGF
jgi:hypothetical protein